MADQRQSYQSIQAGRGIAAIMVVLFHASAKVFAAAKYWNVAVFGGLFDFGHAGVDFFFVLSGFIVAHVHAADIGQPTRLASFVRSRVVRVYPVYWLVLAGVIALSLLPFGLNARVHMTPEMFASAVVLFGRSDFPTILTVAWTLFHEIAFYAVFAVAIVSPRAGLAVAGVWLAGIFAAKLGHPFLPVYLGDGINLLFLFGVGARWWAKRFPGTLPTAFAWIGAAGFLALGMENVFSPVLSYPARHLLFGTASTIIIAALVAAEKRKPIEVGRLLSLLGAASYSIYLTHFPVLGFIAKIHAIAIVRALPVELSFALVVGATILIGIGFYLWVEKPLTRILLGLWKIDRPKSVLTYPDRQKLHEHS